MAKAVDETAAHRAALEGKPIEKYGLKLWGITMGRYEDWARCKKVWLARQSTFPVFCITMPFLNALWAMDMDALERIGKPAGFMYMAMECIGMALGLREECVREGDILVSANDETRELNAIIVKLEDGATVELTPSKFNKIREIVAWMQGEQVPDESLNDELLEAEQDLSMRNAPDLNYSLLDMEASVALNCGVRTRDVLDWSILEFETTRRAIERDKKHMICGIGATNGCKWEGGNPYPSWCFDRAKNGSSALIAQSEFGKHKVNKKE